MASDWLLANLATVKKLIILSLGKSRTSTTVDGVTCLYSYLETILRIL